ncbi:mevalonate kinase family protein [Weissella cibaria]|uniref:mevalonate kinase family protein n=1 Tax=Weissella cibaria TaxID=137591 RepID=UPI001FA9158B|nr:hypothetical protein [Weissella cibaria]
MVMAKAPGKLYLAGEYAVTLPGQPSIIMAVDRFVTVNLDPRTDALISVTSNLLGHRELSSSELLTVALDDDWRLVLRTLQLIQTYAIENGQPFTGLTVSIDSQLTMAGQKLGLGSSAAVVMALIKAYVALSELPMSSIQQYKLGALATLTTPNFKAGSMGIWPLRHLAALFAIKNSHHLLYSIGLTNIAMFLKCWQQPGRIW